MAPRLVPNLQIAEEVVQVLEIMSGIETIAGGGKQARDIAVLIGVQYCLYAMYLYRGMTRHRKSR
jgi:hypothetical protein